MPDPSRALDRRAALGLGATTLSAAGLLAVLGVATPRNAFAAAASSQDVALLNAAIALEHEGIAAYQLGAESGLLTPDVLKTAVTFQGHHKQHRDELAAAVRRIRGVAEVVNLLHLPGTEAPHVEPGHLRAVRRPA